jgi:hypothetical protein
LSCCQALFFVGQTGCFNNGFKPLKNGGAEGARTPDPHNAIVVLYQLSYDPIQSAQCKMPTRIVKTFFHQPLSASSFKSAANASTSCSVVSQLHMSRA